VTQVINTGDTDLDITIDGAFIAAPAGATIDVPHDLAEHLGEPFAVVAPAKTKTPTKSTKEA